MKHIHTLFSASRGGLRWLLFAILLQGVAHAQSPSDRPIKLVVPYPPGGISDLVSRSFAQSYQQSTKQPMVVENKPGGSGVVATDSVAKAPPDGSSILLVAIGPAVINNHLFKKLPYDFKRDLVPVALLAQGPSVLVVRDGSPYRSVNDLLKAAKATPGALPFGSFGNGTSSHLAAALLADLTGTSFNHVPYKGSAPALTDLLGGQTAFMFDSVITSLPHIKSGKLRALAITSAARSPLLPQVPTFAEAGVATFTPLAWYGLYVPAGTPRATIDRINREVANFAKDETKARPFREQGVELVGDSPESFQKFVESEDKLWGGTVKRANITLE